MNHERVQSALMIATSRQQRYDFAPPSAEKMTAKTFARDLLYQHLERRGIQPAEISVLDVGHEPYYAGLFHQIVPANLPDHDLHDLKAGCFRAVLAMHVLEHSPFPLLALLNLKSSLTHDGVLYVAVPIVEAPFLTDPCHFSVLHPVQWKKLFADAGLVLLEESTGKFNTYATAIEWRFVLGR